MSDAVSDPVVEPEVKQEVSPEAELTTPPADSQVPVTEESEKAHPLSPEGDRFKQVWARAKSAEEKADELREQLQREREERIRLEERTKVHEEKKQEQVYTWAQLEDGIAQGTITRAWANEYREKVVKEQAKKEALEEARREFSRANQGSSVDSELNRYVKANPDIMKHGSEVRQRVEREYAYLVRMGSPDTLSTQLAATRAALGDIEAVEKAAKQRPANTETFMETHTPSKKNAPAKSFEETLSADVKDHYRKMMKGGAIKMNDWKTVEEIEKRRTKVAR